MYMSMTLAQELFMQIQMLPALFFILVFLALFGLVNGVIVIGRRRRRNFHSRYTTFMLGMIHRNRVCPKLEPIIS
jgi:uncharacterized membrane protein YozB (DUF420 family)